MNSPHLSLIFFGSFMEYSALVLEGLLADPGILIAAVITTPAVMDTKKQQLLLNPVQVLAEKQGLPVFTPSTLDEASLTEILAVCPAGRPDYLVTAGYGKLLPVSWLSAPTHASLNLHFSLLPAYRGANPAEWALLRGETQTGITLMRMSPTFDTGEMIAQASIPLAADDTRESVYQKLYELGKKRLSTWLHRVHDEVTGSSAVPALSDNTLWFSPPQVQSDSPTPYARRLKRDDGFVEWSVIIEAQQPGTTPVLTGVLAETFVTFKEKNPSATVAAFLAQATRALQGFPGLWTLARTTKGTKRLKILAAHAEAGKLVLDQVQLEGQKPSGWNQIKNLFA